MDIAKNASNIYHYCPVKKIRAEAIVSVPLQMITFVIMTKQEVSWAKVQILADSRLKKIDMKRLYAMDSTTITLFKEILKGCGRQPKEGKKKGGIKAHTIIRLEDKMPCFVRYSEASKHDHTLLKEVSLPEGSTIVFDKGYVDYGRYEQFTEEKVYYVTRMKDNAIYESGEEYDIPDDAPDGVLKDEEITRYYGDNQNAIEIQIWSAMLANLPYPLSEASSNANGLFLTWCPLSVNN